MDRFKKPRMTWFRFYFTGLLCACAWSVTFTGLASDLPETVHNTQNPTDHPLSPQEAVKKMTLAKGFQVSLFAGEPDVYQPIAFDFDDRGRLWVVECFSYPDFQNTNKDRILIFTD